MIGVLGDIEYGKGREVEGSGTSVTIQICLRGKTCTTVWFKEGDILEAYYYAPEINHHKIQSPRNTVRPP